MSTALRTLVATMVVVAALAPVAAFADSAVPQGAQVVTIEDVVLPGRLNPCTQQHVDVTLSDMVVVTRTAEDRAGNLHVVEIFRGTFSTSDGFTGIYRQPVVANDFHPGHVDDFTAGFTTHFSGANDLRQRVVFTGRFHLRVRDGEMISSVDLKEARCAGRPRQ